MFEISVARKYLTPRWRQLSVSIISLISILVIALVVWLIVVFFSVTRGLEKSWINKLIALTAPVRILPTGAYYDSTYYKIDSFSAASDYMLKSIGEKLQAPQTDPYDPQVDAELPRDIASAMPEKDLVKEAFHVLGSIPGIKANDFEMTASNMRLQLFRKDKKDWSIQNLNQASYIGSFDPHNTNLSKTLLGATARDLDNILIMSELDPEGSREGVLTQANRSIIQARLKAFYNNLESGKKSTHYQPITSFSEAPEPPPLWLYQVNNAYILPSDPLLGDGVLLPRSFREAGVLLGDRGYLTYAVPTASSIQEQRAKIFVAGFYDPGIIPLGGKFVLTSPTLTGLIRSSHGSDETNYSNGINVYFADLSQADAIKANLQKAFDEAGLAPYWRIETYREYEFTRDLIQQLSSEKNLFTLLATIIIIVACSNIISMLIILVNDKKTEIGILRSMGATSRSIALIFGTCGIFMGVLGSLIGILAAIFTLEHLQTLIDFISKIQGYQMFNPHFYGEKLPTELSYATLSYVMAVTALISLLAGLVPAIKASLLKPSAILRAE